MARIFSRRDGIAFLVLAAPAMLSTLPRTAWCSPELAASPAAPAVLAAAGHPAPAHAAAPVRDAAAPASPAARAPAADQGAPGGKEGTPLVLESFPSYLQEVEKIRGLTFKGPVSKERQSIEEFRAFIAKELDRDVPAATAGCTSRALFRLGLIPEPIDLRKAYGDILLSQVAAYYNPERRTFYVVRTDLPAETMKPTVVHELTHALQDQRFGIGARMEALRKSRNEDKESAFRFLAEGEATYVMTLGALREFGIDPEKNGDQVDAAVKMTAALGRDGIAAQIDTLAGAFDAETIATLKGVLSYPDYFFRLLLDPYYVGQSAVHAAYRRGGWAAVNDLWKNPPTSTELFLHPEKLAAAKRDEPVEVQVPDLSSALGPGYAPACENTLGEMETEILFETALPKSESGARPADDESGGSGENAGSRLDRARQAAAGWGGDRYRAFEKNGGGTVVVWKTTWDTDQDAAEFMEAMADASRARVPGGRLDFFFVPKAAPRDRQPSSEDTEPRASSDIAALVRNAESAVLWKTSSEPSAESLLLLRKARDLTFVAGATAAQSGAIVRALSPSLVQTPSPATTATIPAAPDAIAPPASR